MGFFSRKKYIEKENFPSVIGNLSRAFETLREEYIFGSLSQLKREGIDVSGVSRDITPESELEDLLKGFQLTSMMGIAWDYIRDIKNQLEFDELLSKNIDASKGTRLWNFRERYTDCQGNMECLAKALSVDVHRAIGSPEPKIEFLIQFQGGANLLIVLSQVATYSACGDHKMEQKLKQRIRM